MDEIGNEYGVGVGTSRSKLVPDVSGRPRWDRDKVYTTSGADTQRYILSIPAGNYDQPFRVTIEFAARNESVDELPTGRIDTESPRSHETVVGEAFRREMGAFELILPDLLRTHLGKFVAVFRGRVVDHDDDEFALARRVERDWRNDFVLIQRVPPLEAEDHMESPESEPL